MMNEQFIFIGVTDIRMIPFILHHSSSPAFSPISFNDLSVSFHAHSAGISLLNPFSQARSENGFFFGVIGSDTALPTGRMHTRS